DIETERRLLTSMGAEVELGYGRAQPRTRIKCAILSDPVAKYEIVKTMRASSLVLGPLIARTGIARVAMPGGCAIGGRPIDLHIKGLEAMGATITQDHGYLEARTDRLKGAHIVFDKITVTGTEDLLMAATLADGETLFENCAREPEVTDLAAMLVAMGAKIEGACTSTIKVKGVSKLHGARYRINPDRIEAGTFLLAGAITGGDLNVDCCNPKHLGALIAKLEESGVRIEIGKENVRVRSGGSLKAADISTEEYPGFPTDMQAQYMTLATQTEGTSTVTENIFENRFMHVQELNRMGANITVQGRTATVRGRTPLESAAVMCSDLRASASLVLAALVADGETTLDVESLQSIPGSETHRGSFNRGRSESAGDSDGRHSHAPRDGRQVQSLDQEDGQRPAQGPATPRRPGIHTSISGGDGVVSARGRHRDVLLRPAWMRQFRHPRGRFALGDLTFCRGGGRGAAGAGPGKFCVVRQSWGGMLSIEYALKYQHNLRGLVISNMTAGIRSYLKRIGEIAQRLDPVTLAKLQELEAAEDYDSPEYQRIMMEELYPIAICRCKPWPESVVRAFRDANLAVYNHMQGKSEFVVTGTFKNWERWDSLHKIKVKTLTLGAENDTMDPEDIKKMATLMPNATSAICPEGSHLAMWDDQAVYFEHLLKFLRSL